MFKNILMPEFDITLIERFIGTSPVSGTFFVLRNLYEFSQISNHLAPEPSNPRVL